jgi:peptide/nickel transport system permease protein
VATVDARATIQRSTGGAAPPEWSDEEIERVARERGRLRRIVQDIRRTPPLLVGLGLLVLFTTIAVVEATGEYLAGTPLSVLPTNYAWVLSVNPPGPSASHPFGVLGGTVGADLLQALLQATPWDLYIIGLILILAVALGTAVGVWAGYVGGLADAALTSVSDLMLAVPPFFLVIIFYLGTVGLVQPQYDLDLLVGFFVIVLLPYYARPVRARAERVSREPYVEAARAAGARDGHILRQHILPNSLFPVFAQIPVDLYNIFFVLTVFPFLGCFGGSNFQNISPLATNFPEWGNLLAQGMCAGWSPFWDHQSWWMYAFPAVVIVVFGLAVMLTCDGLERLLHGRTQTA